MAPALSSTLSPKSKTSKRNCLSDQGAKPSCNRWPITDDPELEEKKNNSQNNDPQIRVSGREKASPLPAVSSYSVLLSWCPHSCLPAMEGANNPRIHLLCTILFSLAPLEVSGIPAKELQTFSNTICAVLRSLLPLLGWPGDTKGEPQRISCPSQGTAKQPSLFVPKQGESDSCHQRYTSMK